MNSWRALDWLIAEGFTSLDEQVEIAWKGWNLERAIEPEIPFAHALGYAVQEAYVQYEYWKTGRTNDNIDDD